MADYSFHFLILTAVLIGAHLLAGFVFAMSRKLFGPLLFSLTYLVFLTPLLSGTNFFGQTASAIYIFAILINLVGLIRFPNHFSVIPFKLGVFLSFCFLSYVEINLTPTTSFIFIICNSLYALIIIKALVGLSSKDQLALILLAETQAMLADRKQVLEETNRQIAFGNMELERANKKMSLILDTANDAFISMDGQGVMLEWNKKAQTLFGLSSEETLGKKINVILIPDTYQREIDSEMMELVTSSDKYVIDKLIEVRAFKKSGDEFPAEMSLSILQYEGNYTFNAFIRDISDRKRLEQMKDEFLSTVSHELRTPLAIIKGAVSNLKDGILGSFSEKQQKVIETVDRNIARLARLINDLLDLSRLESGKINAHLTSVNLTGLVTEIVAGFKGLTEESKLTVFVNAEQPSMSIQADIDMLTQVMTNLISNALRYAKSSVLVDVQIQSAAESQLKISKNLSQGDSWIHISIKDDGIGIDEQQVPMLFNKFHQINRPQGGSGYKGTGLGLAICKEIVHLHHGDIWAESLYGHGATFHVLLPVVQPA